MTAAHLNLARKWRPRTFDEVVGQEMAVSMLRNSLFKNHFFPVYLFAGQKGCGKTSSARILATAANCEQLAAFQKKPSGHRLPCLECASCTRMQNNTHADFIEIDAASHTGVDDVRALLESCSFMPLMGNKKIYLIDEAHMLSKAAFNAFLKVLEEPPPQVLFMMATTELHKIPETVRSRCFQLHFSAINRTMLHAHLATICEQEKIECEPDALSLILHETDGSARDALNLLEQVRFSGDTVTQAQVRKALGIISPVRLAEILALAVENKPQEILATLQELNFESLNAPRLWQLLLGIIRTLLWYTYQAGTPDTTLTLPDELRDRILAAASKNRLHAVLQLLWEQEELFLATPYQHAFLEKVLLDVCRQMNVRELDELKALVTGSVVEQKKNDVGNAPQASQNQSKSMSRKDGGHSGIGSKAGMTNPESIASQSPGSQIKVRDDVVVKSASSQKSVPAKAEPTPVPQTTQSNNWQSVCTTIATHNDPILSSIFQQAQVHNVDTASSTLTLGVAAVSPFFENKINETKQLWQPAVAQHFSGCTQIKLITSRATAKKLATPSPAQSAASLQTPPPAQPAAQTQTAPPRPTPPTPNKHPNARAPEPQKQFYRRQPKPQLAARPSGTPLVLTDENKEKWPRAHTLHQHFPGKLEILKEAP